MTVENTTIDGRNICRLSGALSIWNAADIWQQISPLLASADPLIFDMREVSDCDGSGIQIICQIQNAIEKENKEIAFEGISEPLMAAAKIAGLDMESFSKSLEGE